INYDPNFDMDIGWHSSGASFTVPVAFDATFAGQTAFQISVRYMVCNDSVCLPPTTRTLTSSVMVAGVAADPFIPVAQAVDSSLPDDEPDDDPRGGDVLSEGAGAFIWLALTAGFAALLTPCVFPMIPLTFSFFSKDNGTRGK